MNKYSKRVCAMPGCETVHNARGYCKKHYDQKRLSGELGIIEPHRKERALCSFSGCGRRTVAKGLCQPHWAQNRSGSELTEIKKRRSKYEMGDPCGFQGCIRLNEAQGWCLAHYQQWKSGSEMRPIRRDFVNPRDPLTWSRTTNAGYVYLHAVVDGKMKHIAEHRAVMERKIGRSLLDQETVHHINGVKNDNRVENLELWSHSHPRGQRVEDKADWAEEILKIYRPESLNPTLELFRKDG